MDRKTPLHLALAMAVVLLLSGCAAETATDDRVYNQRGMEISRIAHEMGEELYANLYTRKALEQGYAKELRRGRKIDTLELPEVAVTSFVDTDTYEHAGHLGRVLGEFFVHELSDHGLSVYEYKLTGAMAVSTDGEYIYSRDFRKLLGESSVSNLLSGTISRNEDGVVLVARIVDLETRLVQASATGFIPYSLLPYCYQTKEKQCSLNGIEDYLTKEDKDEAAYRARVLADIRKNGYKNVSTQWATGEGTAVSAPAEDSFNAGSGDPAVVRAVTGKGTLPPEGSNVLERALMTQDLHDEDPYIYEAGAYLQGGRLSRDIGRQSQYLRVDN